MDRRFMFLPDTSCDYVHACAYHVKAGFLLFATASKLWGSSFGLQHDELAIQRILCTPKPLRQHASACRRR